MSVSKFGKWVSSLIVLLVLGFSLLFPEIVQTGVGLANNMIGAVGPLLLIIPILIYALLCTFIWEYLWEIPRDSSVLALAEQESYSLTLVGFCFTSLSLLVAFFKDEIKRGEPAPEKILLFFAFALGCFIASYMALRYRTKNLFSVLSEAFIDNGLWCVLAGFWLFSERTPALKNLSSVFALFIVLYFAYLALHLWHWLAYTRRKTN